MSVPSGPMMARRSSTLAVSPTARPVYSKVPSLKDSNSIVALSVSISANISPSSTKSPTFFNQLATVPSSMVSLKRGIVTTTTPSGSSTDAVVFVSTPPSTDSSLVSICPSWVDSSPDDPSKSEDISSPSSPIMANNSSTFVVSPS